MVRIWVVTSVFHIRYGVEDFTFFQVLNGDLKNLVTSLSNRYKYLFFIMYSIN